MTTCRVRPATASPRRPRLLAAALLLVLAAAATRAGAAPHVFADLAGLCAGQSPCFTTIQEAVDNAGPAPATVSIFPGLYAESVSVSAMGSAIGGGPGDLSLRAVDAGGAPTVGGVVVDPGAPGGPGTGFAVGVTSVFPGSVSVAGLTLTSPDAPGLALSLTGDAVLDHLLIEGCGSLGGGVVADGTVTATVVRALLNAGTGLVLEGSEVEVDEVEASRNGGVGLGVAASGAVDLHLVLATLNVESGIRARSCSSLVAEQVTADLNATGAELVVEPADCLAPAPGPSRGGDRLLPRLPAPLFGALDSAPRRQVGASSHGGTVIVSQLSVSDNGGPGAGISAPAAVHVDGALARRNASAGMVLLSDEMRLDSGTFTENGSGLVLLGGSAEVTQVVASDNAPAVPTPPFADGSGIVVGLAVAGGAVFDLVVAERNGLAGLLLVAEPMGAVLGPVAVSGSRFVDNLTGISSRGPGKLVVQLAEVEVRDNTVAGLALPDLQNGHFQRLVAQGNGDGIAAGVAGDLQVLQSEVRQNGTGIRLALEPGAAAAVRCSNVRESSGPGLELLAGEAVDARRNFWGAASGPTHPGNPGGSGDQVVDAANGGAGTVDYSEFLAAPATVADCQVAVTEIPTAGGLGLALLAVLLAVAGIVALRHAPFAG